MEEVQGQQNDSVEASAEAPAVREMTIAPGGHIYQTIVADPLSAYDWDVEKMVMFNVQLIDVASCDSLGIVVPSTPITAEAYAENGYPFFNMYEEPSNIFGKFPLQSVGRLDQDAGLNCETHAAERGLVFPTKVILNNVDPKSPFCPTGTWN